MGYPNPLFLLMWPFGGPILEHWSVFISCIACRGGAGFRHDHEDLMRPLKQVF